ncbi:hypothetical protein PVL29_021937 [Vitis rotundifolia]|uniref:Transmembrane protein n=1 Tax=Vitis rotundifolia TaxID=103349 RepID=A0AA39DA74_VITRO|nr:hypothetical protein PVL29_021937 [Vitis rotundifolia]
MSLPGKARVVFFLVLIFPIIPFVSSRPLNGVEPIARTPVHAIWVRHERVPVPPSEPSSCTHIPRSEGGHCPNLP